jgi:dipeptidyl aminopeptidase/acylaminoacyl peptidase
MGADVSALQAAPFGTWQSPISAELVAGAAIGFGHMAVDGEDVYWIESRPRDGGRSVIVCRRADGTIGDVTPAPFSARTLVHEYGGGDFAVDGGVVFFANLPDQRLYRQARGSMPRAITAKAAVRYADAVIDRRRGRLICVCEDHGRGGHELLNTLTAVDLQGNGERVLVEGYDFFSSPRLSPDGRRLAWLAWNHPNMPWDGTELWMAGLTGSGAIEGAQRIAGGPSESIVQPEWSPAGVLHFVSDRSGWWNLYRWLDGHAESLCRLDAEFGRAAWVFGSCTYGFESASRILCAYTQQGRWLVCRLDRGMVLPIELPYTDVANLRVTGRTAWMQAADPMNAPAIVRLDLDTLAAQPIRLSTLAAVDADDISIAESIAFPSTSGELAYALFYRPRRRAHVGLAGTRPPLLLKSHGGPTAAASSGLDLKTQYWTSRGFAVLEVNYGGSTGYGRAYRERLNGRWGIADVDDCVSGALYLVARGEVDRHGLVIRGNSAGGYTVLCALTFRDIFKAGASYYGIADLETLAQDTHKFESHYAERLVAPYPERRDVYRERSPINFPERLSCPIIFFQGLDDPVVPPDQAQRMAGALRAKGVPVAYVPFAGEGHGFRRAESIVRALQAELYFYSRVFEFPMAELADAVAIENL